MPPKRAASAGAISARSSKGKAAARPRGRSSRNEPERSSILPTIQHAASQQDVQQPQTPSPRASSHQASQTPYTGRLTRRQVAAHPDNYSLHETFEDPERIGRPADDRTSRRSSEGSNTHRSSRAHQQLVSSRFARLPGVQEEEEEEVEEEDEIEEDDNSDNEDDDEYGDEVAGAPVVHLPSTIQQQSPHQNTPDIPIPSVEPTNAVQPHRSWSLRPGETVARWLSSQPFRYDTPAVRSEPGHDRSSRFDAHGTRGSSLQPNLPARNSEPRDLARAVQNTWPLGSFRRSVHLQSLIWHGIQHPETTGAHLRARDDSNRSLWQIFRTEVHQGLLYRKERHVHVSFLLAILLLRSVMCSAGPICEHNHATWLLAKLFWTDPWETVALCGVYTLLISGLYDSLQAIKATIWEIGTRASRRQPLFHNWKGFWKTKGIFFKRYILPIGVDVVNRIFEPVMMIVLTLALRWQQTWVTDRVTAGILAFNISLCLHIAKWLGQAVERKYKLRGGSWLQKPVVFFGLVTLALVAITMNWQVLSFSLREDYRAARAYWQSEQYAQNSNASTISIAGWIRQPTRAAATQAYRITSMLVASGVLPTMSGL